MRSENTYQTESSGGSLETYEWDNPWWEQTAEIRKKRIFYIGDSISRGIRSYATEISENRLLFDNFATSKALDNPCFTESIALFAKQQGHRSAILFNNGLHGWHLDDALFCGYYKKMIDFLKNEFPETPIIIVLSTAVGDAGRNGRVMKRNEIAVNIAKANRLSVIDLFSVSEGMKELQTEDTVHFTEEGYKRLARFIVDFLEKQII